MWAINVWIPSLISNFRSKKDYMKESNTKKLFEELEKNMKAVGIRTQDLGLEEKITLEYF